MVDTLTDSYFWYTILSFIGVFIVAILLGESDAINNFVDKIGNIFKGEK